MYGTQVRWENGLAKPENIRNPRNVEIRRKKFNLPPLTDYLDVLNKKRAGGAGVGKL